MKYEVVEYTTYPDGSERRAVITAYTSIVEALTRANEYTANARKQKMNNVRYIVESIPDPDPFIYVVIETERVEFPNPLVVHASRSLPTAQARCRELAGWQGESPRYVYTINKVPLR